MGWIIVIVTVVGLIIFLVSKDYKEDIKTNVSSHGGMQSKYDILVEYFSSLPSARITKMTNNSITISSPSSTFYIDYVGGTTEVSVSMINPFGNISKKWKFPNGYPQEKMIQEIENYLDWEVEKYKKAVNQNFNQYIN